MFGVLGLYNFGQRKNRYTFCATPFSKFGFCATTKVFEEALNTINLFGLAQKTNWFGTKNCTEFKIFWNLKKDNGNRIIPI